METVLFRVTQEALTNIVKHANAKNISIELTQVKRSLQLKIRDDGVGFDLEEKRPSVERRGSGLIGMRERISALHGTFNINSTPNKGTQISIRLPLENDNE